MLRLLHEKAWAQSQAKVRPKLDWFLRPVSAAQGCRPHRVAASYQKSEGTHADELSLGVATHPQALPLEPLKENILELTLLILV